MIIAFIGRRGSGKTLSMIRYALGKYNKGNNIFTNLKLNFPKRKAKIDYLNKEFFENYKHSGFNVINSVVLVDEAHVFIDSRNAMSQKNKLFAKFCTQSRKRSVDLCYTTQDLSVELFLISGQIDLRIRKLTDYIIFCEYAKTKKGDFVINNICDQYGRLLKKEVFLANEYFDNYDTNEIIDID